MRGGVRSSLFSICNGTRQGSLLSPALFAVYVDDLLQELRSLGVGCYVANIFCGAVGFCDDIRGLNNHSCYTAGACSRFALNHHQPPHQHKLSTPYHHPTPPTTQNHPPPKTTPTSNIRTTITTMNATNPSTQSNKTPNNTTATNTPQPPPPIYYTAGVHSFPTTGVHSCCTA